MKALISQLTFIFILAFAANAFAFTENDLGGSVQAVVDGKTVHFPALKTDIRAKVQGDLTTVTVTQTFANPTSAPLECHLPVSPEQGCGGPRHDHGGGRRNHTGPNP